MNFLTRVLKPSGSYQSKQVFIVFLNSLLKSAFLMDQIQILVFSEIVLSYLAVLLIMEKGAFSEERQKNELSLQSWRNVSGSGESLPKRIFHNVPSVCTPSNERVKVSISLPILSAETTKTWCGFSFHASPLFLQAFFRESDIITEC